MPAGTAAANSSCWCRRAADLAGYPLRTSALPGRKAGGYATESRLSPALDIGPLQQRVCALRCCCHDLIPESCLQPGCSSMVVGMAGHTTSRYGYQAALSPTHGGPNTERCYRSAKHSFPQRLQGVYSHRNLRLQSRWGTQYSRAIRHPPTVRRYYFPST